MRGADLTDAPGLVPCISFVACVILAAAPAPAAGPPPGGAAPNAAAPTSPASESLPGEAGRPQSEEPAIRWDPYGYIKLDASVDSSLIEPGNFVRWVADPVLDHEHAHYNMTVRQTRLGVWLLGPEESERPYVLRGRVEIDFYGGGGGENKQGVQLRHAYLQIDWPERDLTLVAGQTSDIVSPLLPRMVNYTVAWWSGNIGYRRPLLGVTKRIGPANGAGGLMLAGGVSRTIGDDFKPDEPGDAGADSGLPTVQGRAGYSWTMAGRPAALGVSGHWGQEDVGTRLQLADHELDSWSANLDALVPLGNKAALKAEAFVGRNLDDYFGGAGQGINLALERGVRAAGGWAALELEPTAKTSFAFGFGIDDPDDDDLAPGGRTLNRSAWGNGFCHFTDYLTAAAEVSWWASGYKGREDARALRFQGALIFSF